MKGREECDSLSLGPAPDYAMLEGRSRLNCYMRHVTPVC